MSLADYQKIIATAEAAATAPQADALRTRLLVELELEYLLEIQDCSFKDNVAVGTGGAIYIDKYHTHIKDCVFEGNSAVQGGALFSETELTLATDILI